jgi:hypothetical protein
VCLLRVHRVCKRFLCDFALFVNSGINFFRYKDITDIVKQCYRKCAVDKRTDKIEARRSEAVRKNVQSGHDSSKILNTVSFVKCNVPYMMQGLNPLRG